MTTVPIGSQYSQLTTNQSSTDYCETELHQVLGAIRLPVGSLFVKGTAQLECRSTIFIGSKPFHLPAVESCGSLVVQAAFSTKLSSFIVFCCREPRMRQAISQITTGGSHIPKTSLASYQQSNFVLAIENASEIIHLFQGLILLNQRKSTGLGFSTQLSSSQAHQSRLLD